VTIRRERMTVAQVAEAAGVNVDLAKRLRRAMGLPDVPDDEPAFDDADRDALRLARTVLDMERLSEGELLYLTRTLGLGASRMADTMASFWGVRLERLGESGIPEDGRIDPARLDDLSKMVDYLLRRHLRDAAVRYLGAGSGTESDHAVAVGFADLVGFTRLTAQLSDAEMAELVERFERLASDRVVAGAGRVVKMIGDEVMFAAEPAQVADIALSLAEAFDSPDLPSVRVGVASGRVLVQSGDLYGSVVNLASRATEAAYPGSVLVSPSLAALLDGDERYKLKPLRPRKLKGIGPVELWVLRRASDSHD
jgi:adenylate cyclase